MRGQPLIRNLWEPPRSVGFTLELPTLGQGQGQLGLLGRWPCLMGTPLFKMLVEQKAQSVPGSGMSFKDPAWVRLCLLFSSHWFLWRETEYQLGYWTRRMQLAISW